MIRFTLPRVKIQLLLLPACLLLLGGCSFRGLPSLPVVASAGAKINISSLINTAKTTTVEFDRAIYSVDDNQDVTILLIKGTAENPVSVLTARMFWTPIASQTPINKTATNCTFHYAQFATGAEGQRSCAVYAGAGFLYLYNRAGKPKLSAGIWEANMSLHDASEQYASPLDQSIITGKVVARNNPTELTEMLTTINQTVAKTLGYPRFMLHQLPAGEQLASAK